MVVELELALFERKKSRRFRHNIPSYARKIRKGSRRLALCQGQRSRRAKIEKPRVKILSYDFPKLNRSNPNSFRANVHLRQIKKTV